MKRLRAGALASLAAASAALLSFVHGVPLVILLAVATATAGLGACLSVDSQKNTFKLDVLSSTWPIRRTHRLDGRVAVQQAVPERPVTCRARGAMSAGQPCTQNSMICERLDAVAKLISCVRRRRSARFQFCDEDKLTTDAAAGDIQADA
jgi:hypothetical protein